MPKAGWPFVWQARLRDAVSGCPCAHRFVGYGPGGRDHWPSCYTCLIAGGGVRGGQVYGASDKYGAYPERQPVHPYDLIATIHHALGIAPRTTYRDNLDRPRGLV